MTTKDHKLAAIVFTDMVGFTKQMENSEEQTMQLLQKQREIVFPIVKSHQGEIVKEIGDGLFIIFNSAFEAVHCTIEIQKQLKDEDLTLRAGIHIGDVVFKGGDVFGSAVNVAARLEPLAAPNGICMSADVRSQIKNKDDIKTVCSGKKYLKGVDVPVEVHCVVLGETEGHGTQAKVSVYEKLWQKKLVQILAFYLLISLLIRYLVSTLVSYFVLSPHITGLVWVVLLSLVPTVILVSWFYGEARSKWTAIEKIGLPLNLVFTILLVVFMFKGKDLGAATEMKFLKNEQGDTVGRVVGKSEFRKKIALFFFENKSNDKSLNWMQYAIPTILDYDMSQNMFIQAHTASEYIIKLKEAGFYEGVGAPLMLQKSIAGYYNLNYFVTGSFKSIDKTFIVNTLIYETGSGNLISEFEVEGLSLFEIIDQISVSLRDALELPSYQIEGTKDLSVSAIYTSSLKAAAYFSKANIEIILNNNWDKAIEYTKQAIGEDPGFAMAYLTQAEYYFNNNKMDEAESSLRNVMDNIYKLPERQQFYAKFCSYVLKQEPDKAIAVLEMWSDLFPRDIEAHDILATRYQYKNMFAKAMEEYRAILSLDPYQTKYISFIGDLYQAIGNYDSSLFYFRRYEGLNPGDYKAYWNLGELYLNMAEFDLAAKNLDKALLIELAEINVSLLRIEVDMRLGEFEKCGEQYLELLENCKTINDSCKVYEALSNFFEILGQSTKSLYYHRKFEDGIEKFENPLTYMVNRLFNIDKYVQAGRANDAFSILKELGTKFQPPIDKVVAFGYMFYYIEVDSAENAETYVPQAKDLSISFGEEILLSNIYYAEGRINELKGNYEKALESYTKYHKNQPLEIGVHRLMARCQRKLGDLDDAEKNILIALKHRPSYPKINFEAALLYKAKDKPGKSNEYLQRALQTWKDADESFSPAKLARELEGRSVLF